MRKKDNECAFWQFSHHQITFKGLLKTEIFATFWLGSTSDFPQRKTVPEVSVGHYWTLTQKDRVRGKVWSGWLEHRASLQCDVSFPDLTTRWPLAKKTTYNQTLNMFTVSTVPKTYLQDTYPSQLHSVSTTYHLQTRSLEVDVSQSGTVSYLSIAEEEWRFFWKCESSLKKYVLWLCNNLFLIFS